MADKPNDNGRDARLDADFAFLEELEAMDAGEAPEPLDLLPLATADLQREIDAARAAEAANDRSDLATRLREPNLAFGSLQFLSGLTRAEAATVRRVWPTLAHTRRARLVRAMDELAEVSLELDFHRALQIAARDDAADVREAAIDASWENPSLDFLTTLLDIAAHDESAGVRRAATDALGNFATTAVTRELPERYTAHMYDTLLATANDPREAIEVRRRAVAALGVFDTDAVRDLIEDTYARGEVDDRTSALAAMGRSCDDRWLPMLTDELEAEEHEVRFEATHALGELGQAEAVPDLVARLDDEERAVRLAAVFALGQIGSRNAASALRAHRADEEDEEWTEAIDAALAEASYGDQPFPPI